MARRPCAWLHQWHCLHRYPERWRMGGNEPQADFVVFMCSRRRCTFVCSCAQILIQPCSPFAAEQARQTLRMSQLVPCDLVCASCSVRCLRFRACSELANGFCHDPNFHHYALCLVLFCFLGFKSQCPCKAHSYSLLSERDVWMYNETHASRRVTMLSWQCIEAHTFLAS